MKQYLYLEDGVTKASETVDGSGSGFLFVTNVTSSGNVADIVYVADTVPSDRIIESCLVDEDSVTIHFLVEGGIFYSPTITIGVTECTNLTEVTGDLRLFSGSIDVTITEDTEVTVESSTLQTTSVQVNRAAGPPVITDVRFINGYPGSQTEVKDGDSFDIQVTFDTNESEPTHISTINSGACDNEEIALVGYNHLVGIAVITGTIRASSSSTVRSQTVNSKNAIGTVGTSYNSTDNGDLGDGISTLICNDTVPTFNDNGVTYPISQTAFKDVEVGSQDTQVFNYSSLTYSSPNSDFFIDNVTTYVQDKEITCTNPNHYNDSVTNFRIVALRSANGTSATFSKNIEVADTAAALTVTQNYTRLRSSEIGNTGIITVTSDQNLPADPDITIPVSGTWDGSWSGGPKVFNRNIDITDGDTAGTASWTFNTISTNRAGVNSTISGDQVVGGFVARNLTLEAFANEISVSVEVTDYSKLSISSWSYTGESLTRAPVINTVPPVPDQFTINSINSDPHTFRVLDTNKTNSSSQASTIYGYEEEV